MKKRIYTSIVTFLVLVILGPTYALAADTTSPEPCHKSCRSERTQMVERSPPRQAGRSQRKGRQRRSADDRRLDHPFSGESEAGTVVWEKYYANRKPFNIGYGGDRTEHVLWRLDHGEVDGISPKLAVMMIGTNNIGHHSSTPAQTIEGIKAILAKLEQKLPRNQNPSPSRLPTWRE